MQNKNINLIELDENELINFNFESIITLEELLTYFYDQKLKLKKKNYISFFKIFKFYQIYNSLNLIFVKEKYYKNIFQTLFKLQLISILLDEINSLENKNINEKNTMIIKDCLIINHQNFLILSLILIKILQFHNFTNLYHNKTNKIIFEKLIDIKSYNNINNILNIKDCALKIEQSNKDIGNKIKLIIGEKNIKNLLLLDIYNKLKEISLDELINNSLKILGLKDKEISEINLSLNDKYNFNNVKSVKVPFLIPLINNENYNLTIILDLDGTLIYKEDEEENIEEEEEEDEEDKGQNDNKIILRPGLYEFLDNLVKLKCELIIFTSSNKQRADEIINIIEKNKKYFKGRLYREYCTLIGSAYVKDISKLGRDLAKSIIIDNDLGCFFLQQENGILIKSFIREENDNSLFSLYKILDKIIKSPFQDIRLELDKYRNEFIKLVSK